jgi:hypothetical protein
LTLVLVVAWLSGPLLALKNVCPNCGATAQLDQTHCAKCGRVLNKCLSCGTENKVAEDYCVTCFEPLAEMRILSTIASDVREELRLGASERAQLERELRKLEFQLEKDPANRKVYLYRRARIFRQMDFASREAQAWQEYLKEFPDTPKRRTIEAFLADALRKWGYLFYQQGQREEAMKRFKEAVAANPLCAEAWQWIGRLHSEAKEYQAAGDAYLEALKAKPGDKTSIHFLRGLKRPIPPHLLTAPKTPPTPPAPPATVAPATPSVSPAATPIPPAPPATAPAAPVPSQDPVSAPPPTPNPPTEPAAQPSPPAGLASPASSGQTAPAATGIPAPSTAPGPQSTAAPATPAAPAPVAVAAPAAPLPAPSPGAAPLPSAPASPTSSVGDDDLEHAPATEEEDAPSTGQEG